MKLLIAVALLGLVVGCASKKALEVTMLRANPVNLMVEVRGAKPKFDSAADRFLVEVRVLGPQSKKDAVLHLLVDDLSADRRGFVMPGSRWTITCDEEAFEHERQIGFSFWFYRDLAPKEAPNQPEPTSGLAPGDGSS